MIIIFSLETVEANELIEVTDDIEIRYRWYKEIITGEYIPLKDIKENDLYDQKNIKYSNQSDFDASYCDLPREYYEIEMQQYRTYLKVDNIKNIILENFNYDNNIKIYSKAKEIKFDIISYENNVLKLELGQKCICKDLIFYITGNQNYKISLYSNNTFMHPVVYKTIQNEVVFSPDRSWIQEETKFMEYNTPYVYEKHDLFYQIRQYYMCRYKEKYVYKYNIKKEYYDENYYKHLEGYKKDEQDYKIFYKGKPLINNIEIIKEKIVEVPKEVSKIEYIYVEKENNNRIDSSQFNECKDGIKTKYIEKEITKIPKKIYIYIVILVIIIILLIIKLLKKMSTK